MHGFYLFRILKITVGVCTFFVISFFIFAHAASAAGIWISQAEIMALPMSGSAWTNLLSKANSSCGTPDLANQDDGANVCIMAKALVFARTGTTSYRTDVITALRSIVNSGTYNGRALAIGRELGAYVIAADLISLSTADSALDQQFRSKIREFLTTPTSGGPPSLIDCHEDRPNNWGTHCGASRLAVYAYLGDTTGIARVAQVFKGWLGDRSSYAGFSYGDLSWQCNASAPVGVNPPGCVKDGHNIDGVLPDDQRRCGSFGWPPCQTDYNWEALQGVFAQVIILNRYGYDPQNWSNQAIKRTITWLYNVSGDTPSGDDTWSPWVVNYFYGTSFSSQSPSNSGKNVGWTDWTHSGTTSGTPPPTPTPTPTTYTLSISKSGTGTGTISGTGISCGSTCSTTVNSGTSITITATPASGSTFGGWSGSCSGTGGSCMLSMTANRNVTATFNTSTPTPTPTGIFSLGQQVQATSKVNVRQTPAGTLLGTQASGAVGTVTAGPISAVLNGTTYVWWTINFSSGVDGWVGEDRLNPYTSPTPTPTIITGDFNRDGLVNSIDLSLMTTYWNQNNGTYDLNHDGIVNSLDYVIMVQNWSA